MAQIQTCDGIKVRPKKAIIRMFENAWDAAVITAHCRRCGRRKKPQPKRRPAPAPPATSPPTPSSHCPTSTGRCSPPSQPGRSRRRRCRGPRTGTRAASSARAAKPTDGMTATRVARCAAERLWASMSIARTTGVRTAAEGAYRGTGPRRRSASHWSSQKRADVCPLVQPLDGFCGDATVASGLETPTRRA